MSHTHIKKKKKKVYVNTISSTLKRMLSGARLEWSQNHRKLLTCRFPAKETHANCGLFRSF